MQIVIEIPKEAYNRLLEEQHLPNRIDLEYFIVHGKPLPEKHGRLKDVDRIPWEKSVDSCGDGTYTTHVIVNKYDVDDIPTLIEATEEQE